MKHLPNVIVALLKAQENFDSIAYANCFTETAKVFDESKIHDGKIEIQNWIDKANKEYQISMKPLEYLETEQILKAEISGNFPGSPLVLTYEFEFMAQQIQTLKIS